jgi:hypothetical protein
MQAKNRITDNLFKHLLGNLYFDIYYYYYWSRDSAVGIATGYGLDDEGSQFESR